MLGERHFTVDSFSMPMPLVLPSTESEASLVQRAQNGDAAALGALFDRHGESIYRVAYRLLRSREDAEDTVQDVFGGLRHALSRYSESGTFAAWLRMVTIRAALMRRRAEMRRDTTARAGATHTSPDLALRMTLDAAMTALPELLRDVFVLRAIEGYSHDEIARLLDISASASKVRMHRAVQQLQNTLRGSL